MPALWWNAFTFPSSLFELRRGFVVFEKPHRTHGGAELNVRSDCACERGMVIRCSGLILDFLGRCLCQFPFCAILVYKFLAFVSCRDATEVLRFAVLPCCNLATFHRNYLAVAGRVFNRHVGSGFSLRRRFRECPFSSDCLNPLGDPV